MNSIFKILFAALILFNIFSCNQSDGPAYSIEPPFKSVQPTYDTFTIDASVPKVLHLSSGSSIEIPENAFVDKNGKAVTGKVALKYRAFHTAADILASGIPMLANDENGDAKPFESGGMFEITATANGEEIHIASGKKINVNMASKVEGDFDFYYLEEDGNKNVATASLFLQTQPSVMEKKYRWKKIYSTADSVDKSVERKSEKAKYFQPHFDTKKYPESAMLDTIKWEYAGINKTDDLTDVTNAYFQKQIRSEVFLSKPVYYTEKVKHISRAKDRNQWDVGSLVLLPDSLGMLAHDEDNYLSLYAWDGTVKARFKDVKNVCEAYYSEGKGTYTNLDYINKKHTHLLLTNGDHTCKLFLMDGTLVKDFGVLYNAAFDQTGTKIIGQIGSSDKGDISVSVFSLTGIVLNSFSIHVDRTYILNHYWELMEDQLKIVLVNKDKITVVDTNGKTLSETSVTGIRSWNFIKYNNAIQIHGEGNQILVWDWKKNKLSRVNSEVSNYHITTSPTDPVMIIYKEGKLVLWDWEKNTYKELMNYPDQYAYYSDYSPKGNFICIRECEYVDVFGQSTKKSKAFLFTKDGVLLKTLNKAKSYYCHFNAEEDRIVIQGDTSELYLIDRSGKMIFDFKAYDLQIKSVDFYLNGELYSTTSTGTLMHWDKNVKLLHTIVTNQKGNSFYSYSSDVAYEINRMAPTKKWDLKSGKFLYVYDYAYVIELNPHFGQNESKNIFIPANTALSFGGSYNTAGTIWKNTSVKLPAGAYQLSFSNDSIDFQTYVYVNTAQQELMNQYQKSRGARIDKETKKEAKRAEEENKLLRSFAINNFGTYNWDRFYKDTNAVFVKATMDLDNSTTHLNNITFFLITGKDRNVVVKYYYNTLDKFCFVATDNNMLLAVLPDDKIAVFEEKEFRALDIDKIKRDGVYTFKFKVLQGQTSKAMLDKLLQKAS